MGLFKKKILKKIRTKNTYKVVLKNNMCNNKINQELYYSFIIDSWSKRNIEQSVIDFFKENKELVLKLEFIETVDVGNDYSNNIHIKPKKLKFFKYAKEIIKGLMTINSYMKTPLISSTSNNFLSKVYNLFKKKIFLFKAINTVKNTKNNIRVIGDSECNIMSFSVNTLNEKTAKELAIKEYSSLLNEYRVISCFIINKNKYKNRKSKLNW